jgi:hypothetical protein
LSTWADNPLFIDRWWYVRPAAFPDQLVTNGDERKAATRAVAALPPPRLLFGSAPWWSNKMPADAERAPSPERSYAAAIATFDALAAREHRQHPLRSYIATPLQRMLMTWTAIFPLWKAFSILAGISFLGFVLRGIAKGAGSALLAAALIVGRSVLPVVSILGSEPRYMVEAVPVCFVFCALSLGATWTKQPSLHSRK